MKKDKFLTVYAVLDIKTQAKLQALQEDIEKKHPAGTQTLGIPFHISLGSFPIEMKDELIMRIANQLKRLAPFELELDGIGHFDYKVIYAKPVVNPKLLKLHESFAGNYADGFNWVPHVTLYCGTEEVGKQILDSFWLTKSKAQIIGIQMGEFFPTKIIMDCKF